jgi:hypothetical protein
MAGAPAATLNAALNGVKALGNYISLHTADPGVTGASELAGGSPLYARKQTTWGTPANGVLTGSAQTFDVPAGQTIGWYGVWTAATGGTWVTGGPLRNAGNTTNITETYTAQGQYALTPKMTADNLAL